MGLLADSPPPSDRRWSKSQLEDAARLLDLFDEYGVDVDALFADGYRPAKVTGGMWQTGMKVDDGEGSHRIEVVEQRRGGWEINLSPAWVTGPQWQLIQPGPEFKITPTKRRPGQVDPDGWRTLVCLPDIQAPFHDERALDVALQIIAEVAPDVIVMHGDNLDFEALSRFRQRPQFAAGTQAAIDYMTLFCGELRATAPEAEIVWIAGNHDARLENYVLDNAAAAFGVTRGKLPDEDPQRPALSIPELCRLDESDVTYLNGYPANTYWFQDNVRVIHGKYTSANAATKYLNEGVTSVWGHTHHSHLSHRTLADGRRIYALSAGCLCSVNGEVPGTMTGYDYDGPVRQPVDWDQGVLVARGDGDQFWPELVPIRDGTAWFRDRFITAD